MRRRRGRRVVTPDGHVWFVRRHRARRRPFWAGRGPERFHGEDELPAEKLPLPGPLDLFNTRGEDIGQPGFDRYSESDRVKGGHAIFAITVATVVVGLLVWLTVRYVLPWLVPPVVDNVRYGARGRLPGSRRSRLHCSHSTSPVLPPAMHEGTFTSRWLSRTGGNRSVSNRQVASIISTRITTGSTITIRLLQSSRPQCSGMKSLS